MSDKKLNTYFVCDGDKVIHTIAAEDWRAGPVLDFFRDDQIIATFTKVDWWKRSDAGQGAVLPPGWDEAGPYKNGDLVKFDEGAIKKIISQGTSDDFMEKS